MPRMIRIVHILTEGFRSSNGRAFLHPLLRFRETLERDYGIVLQFFTARAPSLNQCDALLVDSKFYKPYWASPRRDEAVAHFAEDYAQAGSSFFVDLNDSTGWVVPYVLPYVTRYIKSQLMRDRSIYSRPLYEHRPHSDYYHRTAGVANDEERWSVPITDPAHLAKMTVGWNSGLANYSLPGPWLMNAYERTGWLPFLALPKFYAKPERTRQTKVSYRFGASYPERTLRHQRLKLKEIMDARYSLPTCKLNRAQYFLEMIDTQVVLSPFGYGEITLKDFETFLTGGALMKPDMAGIETWPDFFRNDETYVPFSWDLEDIPDRLDALLPDNTGRIAIARNAQNEYKKTLTGPEAARLFCSHFASMIHPPAL